MFCEVVLIIRRQGERVLPMWVCEAENEDLMTQHNIVLATSEEEANHGRNAITNNRNVDNDPPFE